VKPTTNTSTTKEVYFVLLGEAKNGIWLAKLCWRKAGSQTCVHFDGARVLAREESHGDVVGFYHSHPEGFVEPSRRDDDTMSAWSFCFGKPLLAVVATSLGPRAWVYGAGRQGAGGRQKVQQVEIFKSRLLVARLPPGQVQ
jgi:hypothetical protein